MAKIEERHGWRWIERLSWVMVLFAVPTFFAEQYMQWERDKVTNTVEFVKRYQDSQMVNQRFALLVPWLQYDLEKLQQAGPSRRAITDLVLKTIDGSVGPGTTSKTDLRQAVFEVVDFYETLALCIEAGRCNANVARSYFSEHAKRFFCLYEPYIARLRTQQSMPGYGKRFEGFALVPSSCDGK